MMTLHIINFYQHRNFPKLLNDFIVPKIHVLLFVMCGVVQTGGEGAPVVAGRGRDISLPRGLGIIFVICGIPTGQVALVFTVLGC